MLMTEEEAKGQICPLIRYCANELGVTQDGDAAIYVHQNCQASGCKVGWRWGEPAVFCQGFAEETRVERGYCGAFGRVERTRFGKVGG